MNYTSIIIGFCAGVISALISGGPFYRSGYDFKVFVICMLIGITIDFLIAR